jgi:hypothetical protein
MQTNISVRTFRTSLATFLNGNNALIIGDPWHNRAILIPLTNHVRWAHREQRKAIAHAAKEMLRVLALLRAENRG